MRRRSRASRRKTAERAISHLEADLRALGLPQASRAIRVGLRARHHGHGTRPWLLILSGMALVSWTGSIADSIVNGTIPSAYLNVAANSTRRWRAWNGESENFTTAVLQPTLIAVFGMTLYLTFLLAPIILPLAAARGDAWSLSRATRMWRRFEPVHLIARSISACVRVRSASWRMRPRELRRLARSLGVMETEIMQLHRSSGHLPMRSHRRHELRRHAGLVVAALRRAEARIDEEGTAAIPGLASMLMTVADRIAVGRIGALLDPQDLPSDLIPARDWEPVRLAAAAALIAASGVGVGLLNLPDGADAYVVGGCGIVVLTLLYGRRAQQFIDLLSTIRGG